MRTQTIAPSIPKPLQFVLLFESRLRFVNNKNTVQELVRSVFNAQNNISNLIRHIYRYANKLVGQ